MWNIFCAWFNLCRISDGSGNKIVKNICQKHGFSKYCWDSSDDMLEMTRQGVDYEEFWLKQRHPLEKQTIVDSVPRYSTILHLRCGDVPWESNRSTHFSYQLACPKDVAEKNQDVLGHGRVYMLVGGHGGHLAICNSLLRGIKQTLEHLLPFTEFHVLPRKNIDVDFERLRSATNVVAMVPSTFVLSTRLGKLTGYRRPRFGDLPEVSWSYDASACDALKIARGATRMRP